MGSETTQPPLGGVPESSQTKFSTTVTDTTLSEALIVLRKRRWVLIVAVLLGLAYGIYKAESQPRLYDSYGRIQVRSGSSNEYRVSAVGDYSGDASSRLLTELDSLGLRPVAIGTSDPFEIDRAFLEWAEERRRSRWDH